VCVCVYDRDRKRIAITLRAERLTDDGEGMKASIYVRVV